MVASFIPTATDIEQLATITQLDQRRGGLFEADVPTVSGIFDDAMQEYAKYRVVLKFVDRVMGGTPQKADLIAGWIKKNIGVTDDEEVLKAVRETLVGLGVEAPEKATIEELTKAAESVAAERHGNSFKRDSQGLFLEGRHAKAMLKEATNIAFAGDRWGRTKKGPKSALAEWVFVDQLRLHLGRETPDGTFTMHGVVSGPQGSRSTLTQYDYCFQATTEFTLSSFQDRVTRDQWLTLLILSQKQGLGALRSQGFGTFKIQEFEEVQTYKKPKAAAEE